tara:strand:- start:419 stop:1267 length:849 start_codon:yes stop_codon:yes gene_type:complete
VKENKVENINYIFASFLFRAYYTALLESQGLIQDNSDINFNIIPYINENNVGHRDNKVDPSLWGGDSGNIDESLKTRIEKRLQIIHRLINDTKGETATLNIPENFNIDPLNSLPAGNFNIEPDFYLAVDYLEKYFERIREEEEEEEEGQVEKCALVISHSGFMTLNLLYKIDGVDISKKPLNNSLWKFSHFEDEAAGDFEYYRGRDKIKVEEIYRGSDYETYEDKEGQLTFCKDHNDQSTRKKLDEIGIEIDSPAVSPVKPAQTTALHHLHTSSHDNLVATA